MKKNGSVLMDRISMWSCCSSEAESHVSCELLLHNQTGDGDGERLSSV